MTVIIPQSTIYLIACAKHKLYYVGYLFEARGKTYAFRCSECNRPFYINETKFWKGTP